MGAGVAGSVQHPCSWTEGSNAMSAGERPADGGIGVRTSAGGVGGVLVTAERLPPMGSKEKFRVERVQSKCHGHARLNNSSPDSGPSEAALSGAAS